MEPSELLQKLEEMFSRIAEKRWLNLSKYLQNQTNKSWWLTVEKECIREEFCGCMQAQFEYMQNKQ